MTELVASLAEVCDRFDAFIIDQWGVLHNGAQAYAPAPAALAGLRAKAKPTLILSNSGQRSSHNARRLARLGFAASSYSCLLSSGEAVWMDLKAGAIDNDGQAVRQCFAIARAKAEIEAWFSDLEGIIPVSRPQEADIALLLSIANGAKPANYDAVLAALKERNLKLLCANPDRLAPSAAGLLHSPGSVAERYADAGGEVIYYGKPHAPIFQSAWRLLGQPDLERTLVIGDTFGTDILGGHDFGCKTMLVRSGALAAEFARRDDDVLISAKIAALAAAAAAPEPDYSIPEFAF